MLASYGVSPAILGLIEAVMAAGCGNHPAFLFVDAHPVCCYSAFVWKTYQPTAD